MCIVAAYQRGSIWNANLCAKLDNMLAILCWIYRGAFSKSLKDYRERHEEQSEKSCWRDKQIRWHEEIATEVTLIFSSKMWMKGDCPSEAISKAAKMLWRLVEVSDVVRLHCAGRWTRQCDSFQGKMIKSDTGIDHNWISEKSRERIRRISNRNERFWQRINEYQL